MNENMYELKTYYGLAIDPIHIGSGGSRLGRVDLPIIREPGTNLPKIPGTSLSGSARAYTALQTNKDTNEKKFSCAGRGGEGGEKHCGNTNPACPVCIPYGFSKGSGFSMQGLAQFFDAHILFFPVASMVGTIWVTSPMALEGLRLQQQFSVPDDRFYPLGEKHNNKSRLNFGWLMLSKGAGSGNLCDPSLKEIPDIVKQNVILVSDNLFSLIVNSNLEVRTSISIDPQTGTTEEGALFTYEAIPRGTILKFDITYNSGKTFKLVEDVGTKWVKTHVEEGLRLFEILGIGGMGTRGMGRFKILNL
ncbi:MAG TPA: type III-B CRISPR module RAMP protein Cmr4 [Caldisericia bacterium]|nr:type III-B CRISPR module RAMP protein Cmr4 [Caldisericia bacterium]